MTTEIPLFAQALQDFKETPPDIEPVSGLALAAVIGRFVEIKAPFAQLEDQKIIFSPKGHDSEISFTALEALQLIWVSALDPTNRNLLLELCLNQRIHNPERAAELLAPFIGTEEGQTALTERVQALSHSSFSIMDAMCMKHEQGHSNLMKYIDKHFKEVSRSIDLGEILKMEGYWLSQTDVSESKLRSLLIRHSFDHAAHEPLVALQACAFMTKREVGQALRSSQRRQGILALTEQLIAGEYLSSSVMSALLLNLFSKLTVNEQGGEIAQIKQAILAGFLTAQQDRLLGLEPEFPTGVEVELDPKEFNIDFSIPDELWHTAAKIWRLLSVRPQGSEQISEQKLSADYLTTQVLRVMKQTNSDVWC
ncbi:hypothetical protein KKD62_01230 [Patescibacteria group bacterium]|nr:hypothetical protein [Patescibacteria group bacterium]MBU1931434.1 hypothetical protein [Patescibacteria group bacterium]